MIQRFRRETRVFFPTPQRSVPCDYLSFDRERIQIYVDGLDERHDFDLTLFAGHSSCEDWEPIASSDGRGRLTWRERLGANDTGTYYLEVRGWGGEEQCAMRYELTGSGLD